MILAAFIYLCANQGLLVASPVIINTLAVGSVVTTYSSQIKVNLNVK